MTAMVDAAALAAAAASGRARSRSPPPARPPPQRLLPPAAAAAAAATATATASASSAPSACAAFAPSAAAVAAAAQQLQPPRRQFGRIRWYNGRRQLGLVDGDDGREHFVPVGGAVNRNFVPPNSSGLMHGTRVSFVQLPLPDPDALGGSVSSACVDVQPVPAGDSEAMATPQPGRLECGVETRIGGRRSNEDRLVANDLFDLGFLAGIFDGHGGAACADFVSQRLPVALHEAYGARASRLQRGVAQLSPGQEEDLISGAIHDAFQATDEEFMAVARQTRQQDGSTGLIVLVAHGFEAAPVACSVAGVQGAVAKIFIGNCGDCRAVLVRGRKAVRLSEDHKPERPDETARITRAGGMIIREGQEGATYRVGRKRGENRTFLSTSRSFGDLDLKEPKPLVVAEPEVMSHSLTPEDWAVVLGCDGVWNTLSDQDAADCAWRAVALRGGGPVEAAREIADQAQSTGSTDNVTVLVLRLGWAAAPPPRATRTR